MKRYKLAAILMILHGGLLELGGCLSALPLFFMQPGSAGPEQYFSFIVPYFQANLPLMLAIGGIWGAVRLIGAIALLKNRMWGFVLSVVNCVLTMALMMFMLPAGILDGFLACAALILMLSEYFGKKKIVKE